MQDNPTNQPVPTPTRHGGAALDQHAVVAIAQELLSKRFGGSPELDEVELLGGSGNAVVARARLVPSAFLPYRSVVVKHMPYSDSDIDDAAFLREVVAYQFTTSLPEDVRPGPVLLAYDMDQRIVVLTDIGDADTLVDTLHSASDEDRIKILRLLGEQLGHMHAGTAQREQDYDALLSRMLSKHPEYAEKQAARDSALRDSILLGLEILRRAGLEPPTEFGQFAAHAAEIQQGGLARAFTPFDLSPDNIVVSDQIYFLDYEWAGFRNVGFDAASVIAGFPQFLFSRPIADAEVEVFQGAWRREITAMWPRYVDDAKLHNLIVSSLVGWALSSVTTLYADGVDGILALARGEQPVDDPARMAVLRSTDLGPFSDDEVLVRQDLYETFEALSRYAAGCADPQCDVVADFARTVARRLVATD
ncbi:phosphotransferase [uncultured Corynebacterium sp.]|uniref:phosphotransferase n=1 Tax=uncultured Corynebacterium sp. TaxID=159447 RepID=UPI0025EB91CD|nr:phosphotransferase [uncultured Corynebacterium sp.]